MSGQPLLRVDGLRVALGTGAHRVEVLHGVDLEVPRGTTLGVVGESGSGKSTLAKAVVGIHRPESGTISFETTDLAMLGRRARRGLTRRIQLIPQDPFSSLDPRRTIGQTLAEAIDPRSASLRRMRGRVSELLALVRLDDSVIERYPREFSGGQRQRIAIARALAVEPELIIADEITSALDLSTQAEVLGLLADLKERLGLTMIFVSHNLAVVQQVSDAVLVLFRGDVVESGDVDQVFREPRHVYTRTLLDAIPGGPGFRLDLE